MSLLKVEDRGDGWKVYGVWYGTEQAVYTGQGRDELNQIVDCNAYTEEAEADEADESWQRYEREAWEAEEHRAAYVMGWREDRC